MFPGILVAAIFLILFAATALAASLAWNAVEKKRQSLLDQRLQRDRTRLADADTDLLLKDVTSQVPIFGWLLERFTFTETLRENLAQANLRWSVGLLAAMMLVSAFLTLNVVMRVGWIPVYLVPPAVVLAGFLPFGYVRRKRRRRLEIFEEQFPGALDFMARALRAGHAFSITLELLAEENLDPVSVEFRRAAEEHGLGQSLETALKNLARRVPLLDVRFFVSAVQLQNRTGGNLTEILLRLAELIRERFTLRGQVRAYSAQGRLTGRVLAILPVVVMIGLMIVNPDYMNGLLKFPYGKHLIGAAVVLQGIAYWFIRRIVNITV